MREPGSASTTCIVRHCRGHGSPTRSGLDERQNFFSSERALDANSAIERRGRIIASISGESSRNVVHDLHQVVTQTKSVLFLDFDEGSSNIAKRSRCLHERLILLEAAGDRLPPADGAEKGRLVGDVDYVGASEVAGAITPVPGGVGPMTIAVLLRNALVAASRNEGLEAPEGL